MFGPDVPASVTTSELQQLVEGVRFIETMQANPVDKNVAATEVAPLRALFTKSVVARRPLPRGTVLRAEAPDAQEAWHRHSRSRLPELSGRRLRRDVGADELLTENDLEIA